MQPQFRAPGVRGSGLPARFLPGDRPPPVVSPALNAAPSTDSRHSEVFAVSASLEQRIQGARKKLDEQTVRAVQLHFHPEHGAPFWLEQARTYNFNPLKDVKCFDDLKKFPLFEDDWLRGGPVTRFLPKKWHGE